MPFARMTLEFADFNRHRSQVSFDGAIYASDGTNHSSVRGKQVALRATVEAITLGVVSSYLLGGNYEITGQVRSSVEESQTFIQWKCFYTDNTTGARESVKIPTADLSLATISTLNGLDFMVLDLGSGAGASFKTAFEDYVVSKAGNSVTLDSVQVVE